MARANPQWQHADGQRVLVVFSGPHAYVSPAWYETEDVVPTWNYVAVHVTGVLRVLHDPEALLALVSETVRFYEQSRPRPWQMTGSPGYIERMLRGIVGFRIEIENIEGKWKLGQNHSQERRAKVALALREKGGEDAEALAALMEQTLQDS
jgi:transcriptional regulator